VLLEKRPIRRILVDVPFFELDRLLLQKTSGVAAGRSRGLQIKNRFGHRVIVLPPATYNRFGRCSQFAASRDIDAMLTINEIFHSIQGESTHTGRPCVFVRLTACDLRCSWCDTPYAFHEGRKMSVDQVVADVGAFECEVVEITGGEPLLQPDVYPLMQQLLERGHTVMLETGGHRSIANVPPGVIRIVDVKCPGSGESDKNDWSNLDLVTKSDEVKFVIRDREDYEFARRVTADHKLLDRCAAVLFSPVHGVLPARDLAGWILEDRLPVRLQLQAHKYIWSPDTRGV
jgi:7-carboxy-7-deazaguanine synthase